MSTMSTLTDIINKHLDNKGAPPAPKQPAVKTPKTMPTRTDIRQPFNPAIVQQIIKDYPPEKHGTLGVIPWERVWQEHPDWKKELRIDSEQRRKSLGERVRRMSGKYVPPSSKARVAAHAFKATPRPEVRTRAGASPTRLTGPELLEKYPEIIETLESQGIRMSFAQHPDWRDQLLSSGSVMQDVYEAINTFRKQTGKRYEPKAPRKKPAGRIEWTKEQYDLVKAVMNAPQWRAANGEDIDWERAFAAHPDWAGLLNYSIDGDRKINTKFFSFVSRVRHGAKRLSGSMEVATTTEQFSPVEAVPVPGGNGSGGIVIAGKQYQLLELEAIVRAHQNAIKPLNACPECGYPLLHHAKAYTIATRHHRKENYQE